MMGIEGGALLERLRPARILDDPSSCVIIEINALLFDLTEALEDSRERCWKGSTGSKASPSAEWRGSDARWGSTLGVGEIASSFSKMVIGACDATFMSRNAEDSGQVIERSLFLRTRNTDSFRTAAASTGISVIFVRVPVESPSSEACNGVHDDIGVSAFWSSLGEIVDLEELHGICCTSFLGGSLLIRPVLALKSTCFPWHSSVV